MNIFCPLCKKKANIQHTVLTYNYYLCDYCLTLFVYPTPPLTDQNNYYKKSFNYFAGEANENIIRIRARIIINKLKTLFPKGSRLLDIGAGFGFLLDEAQKAGLNITGIEPSKNLVKKNTNKNHIVCGQFPSSKLKNQKYDFITLVHVIEHVRVPSFVIKHALSLLNPEGILYVETPNLDSHLYRFEKENYTFLTPPDHIWVFSQHSFIKMIPSQYQILEITTYSYSEHFMGILKKLVKKTKNNNVVIKNGASLKTKKKVNIVKLLKFYFFDLLIARLFYRLLNLHQYGSILELYIKKK